VQQGMKELEHQLQAKCVSTFTLTALVLARRVNRKLMVAMAEVAGPIEEVHSLGVTQMKTKQGVLNFHTRMANAETSHYLNKLVALLTNAAALRRVGFLSRDSYEALDEGCCAEDQLVAEALVELVRHMLSGEILTIMQYSDTPPARFAAFCHVEPPVRKDCMAWCRSVWEALLNLEQTALEDHAAASFLKDLVWPRLTWVREVFVACTEASWTDPPADISEEIEMSFKGMGTTKGVEDTFNFFTDEARQHKAGHLTPAGRWHRAVSSSILEESDRPPIQVTPDCEDFAERGLPQSLFKCSAWGTSFGKTVVETMAGDKKATTMPGDTSLLGCFSLAFALTCFAMRMGNGSARMCLQTVCADGCFVSGDAFYRFFFPGLGSPWLWSLHAGAACNSHHGPAQRRLQPHPEELAVTAVPSRPPGVAQEPGRRHSCLCAECYTAWGAHVVWAPSSGEGAQAFRAER
jgi:hypothetical protein